MVRGGQVSVVALLEEREVGDPAEAPLALRDQVELVRQVQAQPAEHGVHSFLRAELQEQEVALGGAGGGVDLAAQARR